MIRMLTDWLAAIRDTAKERTRNPLLRAYIGFWLLINWRIPAILLVGDGPIHERMALIDKYRNNLGVTYFLPAVLGLAYVWAMPHVAFYFDRLREKPTREHKKHRMESELAIAQKRLEITEAEVKRKNARAQADLNLKKEEVEIENIRERYKQIHECDMQRESKTSELDAANLRASYLERDRERLSSEIKDKAKTIERLQEEKAKAQGEVSGAQVTTEHLKQDVSNAQSECTDLRNEVAQLKQQLKEAQRLQREAERQLDQSKGVSEARIREIVLEAMAGRDGSP